MSDIDPANNHKEDREDRREKNRLMEKVLYGVAGLVLILILIYVFGAKPCSANVFGISFKIPGCEGEATTNPIAGTWAVSAGQGNSTVDISIIIVEECKAGRVCGTINLPSVPCQASLKIRKIEGDRYEYDAVDHVGACGPAGVEYLELRSDGSLVYSLNGFQRILRRK
ncbi:MAG TPA: hypothetical protein PKL78_14290 [Anaerolineales bacterium]|nr:hypothetical protein [Anaerolineales bacterium]HNO31721.1 hypothetical protein [Anaerolineales bacterium]